MTDDAHDPVPGPRALWLFAALVLSGIPSWTEATEQLANSSHARQAMWLAAETVYRSVDEHGNVTYSARPPAEAEEVEALQVDPAPDPERRQAAEARARAIERAAQQLREAHEQESAERGAEIRAAEEALRRAQERLEKARVKRDEDWQGLAGGGRRLKPSYHRRVQAAEAQLEAAQKRLHDVRR